MSFLQSEALLRSYFLLPHRFLNRGFGKLMVQKRPRWAVRAAIKLWTRRAKLDLRDFEPGPFASVQEFFLRRLRAGARPIGSGFVSPADGRVVAAGSIRDDTIIDVKGQRLSLERVLQGRKGAPAMPQLLHESYAGGHYAVLFLSPRGYHHLHMPATAKVTDWRWLPGRFFPQNEKALRKIPGVYERNERVVLRCESAQGSAFLMVLVGASLVGGIHVDGIDLETLQSGERGAVPVAESCCIPRAKGEEIGHFRFGSTIILLWPKGTAPLAVTVGKDVQMGQTLLAR